MPDNINERISARIRLERESRGWSLSELAERAGVSRAMIHKIERSGSSPTATMLARLSGAFGKLIWLQSGELVFQEGDTRHEMRAGDCLELGPPNDCRFINESPEPCVYLVVRLNQSGS